MLFIKLSLQWWRNRDGTTLRDHNEKQKTAVHGKMLIALAKLALILAFFYVCDQTDIFRKDEKK